MPLKRIGLSEVDGVCVMRVASDILQMDAEQIAKASELGLALVLKTELKRLIGDLLMVDTVYARVCTSANVCDKRDYAKIAQVAGVCWRKWPSTQKRANFD